MAEAKIWTVETVPLKPTIGSHLKVKIAVKNVGESGNTLWLGAKKDGEIAIEKGTFGVPPGRTFKWFIIDCGEYTGDSIDIEIEAGHGWQTKDVDDVFDEEIDENGIQYSAGDNEHDPSYQLNKHVQGEGAIENIPTGGFFLEGTTVELRAVKQLGWNFALWMEGDIELGTQNPIAVSYTHLTLPTN